MEEVQSNAQQYRTRYMQTHVERVEQALTLARDELWATFEMDQERQQYLDGLVADQRAYVRQLESDLAEYQAAVSKAEGVSVREAQETLGGNMELAFRGWDAAAGYRGDNAQRRVDSMKLHQQEWNTPAAAQRVLAGVTEDVSEVMIQALSAGDVDRAVMAMLSDDRVLSVYQQMGVGSSQARAFGVDVMRAVTDATKKARDDQGRPVTTDVHAIQRAVGQQLGLRPEDVDPTIFEADKARAREQMIRESQAGGIIALEEFAARLEARAVEEQQRAVREREAGRAGSPAQELVNDAEAWSYIRADLADNGALDMSNQPEQMQRNREALIEHSDLQRRYQDARTTADTLPQRDQQWFDDLFLQRIGTLGGARAELSRLQTERAGVRPLAPTEEMVRQRAGGIYAPERRRPLVQTPAERAEFQQQTAALQQRGSPGAVRQAGLAAEDWRAKFDALPDDRKILSAQVLRATALPADHRADDQAQRLYQQVKNGTLPKDRIVAVVSDLAKGDMQRRDDLIRDVNWLLMQDWRATRFVPETPPAPEEPARQAPE
jgi:hypothetical protein